MVDGRACRPCPVRVPPRARCGPSCINNRNMGSSQKSARGCRGFYKRILQHVIIMPAWSPPAVHLLGHYFNGKHATLITDASVPHVPACRRVGLSCVGVCSVLDWKNLFSGAPWPWLQLSCWDHARPVARARRNRSFVQAVKVNRTPLYPEVSEGQSTP